MEQRRKWYRAHRTMRRVVNHPARSLAESVDSDGVSLIGVSRLEDGTYECWGKLARQIALVIRACDHRAHYREAWENNVRVAIFPPHRGADERFADVITSLIDNAYEIIRDAVDDSPDAWTFTTKDLYDGLKRMLRAIERSEGITIPELEALLE